MAEPNETAAEGVQEPPRTGPGLLRRLGPGVIIAGSIVGSGELIATTKTGAEAGIALLWLILIGCAIKVFTQVELGRYTLTWFQTPLDALNRVPGPRLKANWIVWAWAIMTVAIVGQQGGIVGSIGQALAISQPLTDRGAEYNEVQADLYRKRMELAKLSEEESEASGPSRKQLEASIARLQSKKKAMAKPNDASWWGTLVALVTAGILFYGRYGLIQGVATVFVAVFTVVTIVSACLIQLRPEWGLSGQELLGGLSFGLPDRVQGGANPVTTALAAFGIIGVGAAELIMYPYWCLEKGYARFTGPRNGSADWVRRARGWMRVMRIDAWGSMVVYTVSTAAFYLLGAAVLWKMGLNPEDLDMVRTLSQMYVPVFGEYADVVFLLGAGAILYSTFFVAAAGNARMVADGAGLFGLHDGSEETRMKWARWISAGWPLVAVALYWRIKSPAAMVVASGIAQAIMLPALGGAALYFRYRRIDPSLTPTRIWDAMLWIAFVGLLIAGVWLAASTLIPGLG